LLAQSQALGSSSARWHYLAGRAYRRDGQLAKAQSHFTEATRLGWNAADIQRQRLLAKAQSGEIKQVQAELVALLNQGASDEQAEEIYEAMSRGYLASFHMNDANKCLQFWLDWQPDNPRPHLWLGVMHTHLEDSDAAIREFGKVLELAPADQEARLKLAQAQLTRLKIPEAADNFFRCALDNPLAPEPLLGLAECRRRQGNAAEATTLLYDALILDLPPVQSAEALATLGRIDLEEGRHAQAIHALQKSVALNPYAPTSRHSLASALDVVGQRKLAAAQRQAALDFADRRKRIVELTRRAVIEPNDADVRCQVGKLLVQQGLPVAAAAWFRTALEISPEHRAAHEGLAVYYRHIGESASARRHELTARQLAAPKLQIPGHEVPLDEIPADEVQGEHDE
jgi:tetratricopeptide (TPR) repeat protein